MRIYNVPVQLDREDKIFGGRVSLRQFIYLVIGSGTGAVMFLKLYKAGMAAAVAAWIAFVLAGCVPAFYKVKEVAVDRYFMMLMRFSFVKKEYPFRGGGG